MRARESASGPEVASASASGPGAASASGPEAASASGSAGAEASGTAEEQLTRMIDAAKIVRSPLVRCVLGTQADRRPDINTHIDETIKVLKNVRSRAMDARTFTAERCSSITPFGRPVEPDV